MKEALYIVLWFAIGIFLTATPVYSQNDQEGKGSKDEVRLPRLFSKYSPQDIFAAVFTDFDRAAGRVLHLRNEQKQPSLVRLEQARLWKSGGRDYLVVMIAVGGYDEQLGIPGLCGNCSQIAPIAVLRAVNGRLELVAKQKDDFYSSQDGKDQSTGFEVFRYTGHDYDVAFDLAPYRLNGEELLIGVRYQHMWIPANSFSTNLLLYRVEGTRIRRVFEDRAVARDWQNGPAKRLRMEKTTAKYETPSAKRKFNQLVVTRKTRKCFADWDTYDCAGGTLVRTEREIWNFDGTTYLKPRN